MRRFIVATLVLAIARAGSAQSLIGSQWTYQGELRQGGAAVDGDGDFQFSLWDAPAGGSQIGSTVEVTSVQIEGGRFTTELDFGADALSGERWLEIAVRKPAGAGAFETLGARQHVSPAPFALQTRGLFVDGSGAVGMGTDSPRGRLHIATNVLEDVVIESSHPGGTHLELKNTSAGGEIWRIISHGSAAFPGSLVFEQGTAAANRSLLVIDSDGRIGIGGEVMPQGLVHVRHAPTGVNPWPIRVRNAVNPGFVTGMRASDTGFFEITNQISGQNFARLSASGNWSAVSDRRAKERIAPMTGALDDAMRLRAVEFAYRGSDEEQIGFIAQDVAPVFPSLVEEGDLLTLNYSGLSVVAIAAIQDLKREKDAEIRTLRERNAALEARLERLEALVTEALTEGGGLGADLGASLGSNLGGGS